MTTVHILADETFSESELSLTEPPAVQHENGDSNGDCDPAEWVHGHAVGQVDQYLQEIQRQSGLKLRLLSALNTGGEFGLFRLFFPLCEMERVRRQTNKSRRLKREISCTDFHAYIELEVATSFVRLGKIEDYWSTKSFQRQMDFPIVMSRNRFQKIRAALRTSIGGYTDAVTKSKYPLWSISALLTGFQQRCQDLAVPMHACTLDENSVRTKARTMAKNYISNKPDKFAVRFYCVVDWESTYLHSLSDNGSGNETGKSVLQRYLDIIPTMRTPVNKVFKLPAENGNARALWATMIAQQTQQEEAPTGKRLAFMDIYYTSNTLARRLFERSDGEVPVIGTVRMNYVTVPTGLVYRKLPQN